MDEQAISEAREAKRRRNELRARLKRTIEQSRVEDFANSNYSVDVLTEVVEQMDADEIARFMVKLGNVLEDDLQLTYDRGYEDGLDDCGDN